MVSTAVSLKMLENKCQAREHSQAAEEHSAELNAIVLEYKYLSLAAEICDPQWAEMYSFKVGGVRLFCLF